MRFSVVIPNFNHGKLLPRAVVALMRQSPLPSEIFIINDGSTDDSLGVIAELGARFDCIRLIHHDKNSGAVAGMNEGLQSASGEYVYFAAADDYAFPPLFARATKALGQHPEAAFFCARVALVSPDGEILGFRPFMQPSSGAAFLTPADVRRRLTTSDQWCVGPAVIYRRQRLLDTGGFDEAMGAFTDGLVVRRLALESGFCFDPSLLVAWEVSPLGLSARTALSVRENTRLVARAVEAVRSTFPADVRDGYAERLGRRLRFNMARLWIVWQKGRIDTAGLAEVLQFKGHARRLLELAARLPFGRHAVLAWMALVLRPYGVGAILAGSYRALRAMLLERRKVEPLIAQARGMITAAAAGGIEKHSA